MQVPVLTSEGPCCPSYRLDEQPPPAPLQSQLLAPEAAPGASRFGLCSVILLVIRSKLASESLNRSNSAMNRLKGPKVAELMRHHDCPAPPELPPDDAGDLCCPSRPSPP